MECQTSSAPQTYSIFRRHVVNGVERVAGSLHSLKIHFPFAFFALGALGLIVYSLPGAIALSLCILQFARCRYTGEQLPGATLTGDGPINDCGKIKHDPASFMWAACYGLIASYFFVMALLPLEGYGLFGPAMLLIAAVTLPFGAAKSAMYSISRKGMLITSHSGFLAEAGMIEAWVVSSLFFVILPALFLTVLVVLLEQILLSAYYLFAACSLLGALYYLFRRTDIFVLGLPSGWEEIRTFSPVIGLLVCFLGALLLLLKKSFLGFDARTLFEMAVSTGIAISYLGARSIETDRKGMVRLVYTHRA